MSFEGGFQGRTNKLVDSCYSFWQGGIFPLIDMALNKQTTANAPSEELEMSETGLGRSGKVVICRWVLVVCARRSAKVFVSVLSGACGGIQG
jgi:hypothetical protein